MSWLPHIGVFGVTTTDPWDEAMPDATGRVLVITWLGFIVELGISRIIR